MRGQQHRLTWAWASATGAVGLLAVAGVTIGAIALTGGNRDDVVLAVALIGFPAALVVFALGTLAVMMARPEGARWRAGRRWALAFVGLLLLMTGLALLGRDERAAALFILAGLSALSFLALDVRRERRRGD